jgi:transaldolase
MTSSQYKSPLHEMVSTTPTEFWNDSSSVEELAYAIEHGAVGATSNPTIVLEVVKKEMAYWKDRIYAMIAEHPTWGEVEVTWELFEQVSVRGAQQLQPVFEQKKGKRGRLSIQTNPQNYRNAEALLEQTLHFNTLAPNMQVKLPVTKAGLVAMEEATAEGVNINATVSFCVPQALAVGAAIERGLKRREAAGKSVADMSPVCTIMIGRLDDWIQVLVKRDNIIANPAAPHWAGVAAFKKAYALYQPLGYRTRLLAAAYRHHLHWSELIGGDVTLTIPSPWQKQFNASDVQVKNRFFDPVPADILDELYRKFPDFRRAYDEDGMTVDEFDTFGPTVRTLRAFISSYHELQGLVRDFMLPNPDVK